MHMPGLLPLILLILPMVVVGIWPNRWTAIIVTVLFASVLVFGTAATLANRSWMHIGQPSGAYWAIIAMLIVIYGVIAFGIVALRKRKPS